MVRILICPSSALTGFCHCFRDWVWPGIWSMECPDSGQAGAAFLAQMFWLHSCGNQLWGQLVHAALWDKAHLILMHPDLGSSAAPLGGCFWRKSNHIFMCSLGKGSLKSEQIQSSKNNAYLGDNEKVILKIWVLLMIFQGQSNNPHCFFAIFSFFLY